MKITFTKNLANARIIQMIMSIFILALTYGNTILVEKTLVPDGILLFFLVLLIFANVSLGLIGDYIDETLSLLHEEDVWLDFSLFICLMMVRLITMVYLVYNLIQILLPSILI